MLNRFNETRKLILVVIIVLFLIHFFLYKTITWSSFYNKFKQSTSTNFYINDLSVEDYNKLVNLSHFTFLNGKNIECSNIVLLVLISSSPNNYEKRNCIRKTWGKNVKNVKFLFTLGISDDQKTNRRIELEENIYKDIVRGNFIDSYKNLTYKSVMSLKYAIYHCPGADYILKVDDDSFVNTKLLKSYLTKDVVLKQNIFFCNDMTNSPAIRESGSKWYVPKEEYSQEMFPSYCSGWYAIFSIDICLSLYKEAQKLRYFYIDDVFVYGMAAEKANLTHTDFAKYTLAYDHPDLLFNGTYDQRIILFGSPNMGTDLIEKFYNYFENYNQN